MAYTNQSLIEQYMGGADLSSVSSFVTIVIAAVQSYIDGLLGTSFEAASTTKYFDTDGSGSIVVSSFMGDPTSVKLYDGEGEELATLVKDEDYLLYPLNSSVKNELILREGGQYRRFRTGYKRLGITASFGSSATVPADVQLAATMLAANVLQNNSSVSAGVKQSESLGDYSVTYATNSVATAGAQLGIKELLSKYIKIVI